MDPDTGGSDDSAGESPLSFCEQFIVTICMPPSGSLLLSVDKLGTDAQLSWTSPPTATVFDLIRGSLGSLRSAGGDFAVATEECIADDEPGLSVIFSETPVVGDGFWFLVRGADCGSGTYDSGAMSQVGLRDAEIAASGSDCP